MKTRQENDVINHTHVVYAKNDNDLSWLIESGADYDKNPIGQLCD